MHNLWRAICEVLDYWGRVGVSVLQQIGFLR